jgi:hypothetical protein
MRRLLKILEMQEEHCRTAMEVAHNDLRRLDAALNSTAERDRGGRQLVSSSASSGIVEDRFAGIEESRAARFLASALRPRIAETEEVVAKLRAEFLAKRIERRQAETVIQKGEAEEAIVASRRTQQALDDWYLHAPKRPEDSEKE